MAQAAHGKGISAQGMPLPAHMLLVAQVPLGPGCRPGSRKLDLRAGKGGAWESWSSTGFPRARGNTAAGDPGATSPACPSVPIQGSAQLRGARLLSSHSLLGTGSKKKSLNR